MSDVTTEHEPTTESESSSAPSWDDQLAAAMEQAFAGSEPAHLSSGHPEAEVGQLTDDAAAGEPALPDLEADPEPEAEPEPEPEPATASALASVVSDLGVDEAEAERALRWVASLGDTEWEAISTALLPQAPTTAASGHGSPVPAPPSGTGDVPSIPTPPDLSVLGEAIPGLPEYLLAIGQAYQEQNAALEALRAQQGSLVEDQISRQREQFNAGYEAGISRFRENYELTDDQFEGLLQRTLELQTLPLFAKRHNGDVAPALAEALENAMWSEPSLRDHLLQSRLDEVSRQHTETAERKRRAASLSGSSGSVPGSRTQAAPANLTPEQRRQQMAAAIAADIAGRAS